MFLASLTGETGILHRLVPVPVSGRDVVSVQVRPWFAEQEGTVDGSGIWPKMYEIVQIMG